ncbi:MAG: hypothetical protein M3Y81_17650 [Chloroflexota bacterium]|nr:hypothetical protein [Chloroflexota bacterium]
MSKVLQDASRSVQTGTIDPRILLLALLLFLLSLRLSPSTTYAQKKTSVEQKEGAACKEQPGHSVSHHAMTWL